MSQNPGGELECSGHNPRPPLIYVDIFLTYLKKSRGPIAPPPPSIRFRRPCLFWRTRKSHEKSIASAADNSPLDYEFGACANFQFHGSLEPRTPVLLVQLC